MNEDALTFLSQRHPYNTLSSDTLTWVASQVEQISIDAGEAIYRRDDILPGIFIVQSGLVSITDASGQQISQLERGNSFGERGLLKDGRAATSAFASRDTLLLCLPKTVLQQLRNDHAAFRRFFAPQEGSLRTNAHPPSLAQITVDALMASDPVTCDPGTSIQQAAQIMRDKRISCLCVTQENRLVGIVTLRDLVGKALAEGCVEGASVASIMTRNPRALPPAAIGSDVLHLMMEHRFGHLPVVHDQRLVGIVTQTDLTRFQANTAAALVSDAARATSIPEMAAITARIPQLLVQLVAAGHRHDVVTRMITDIADVVTRCLLRLAEAELGPPPSQYLWLACGSQGRQEQTGVSDQDNCLILEDGSDDSADGYFEKLAHFVCDGLHACGYVYCPGQMMATNPRWRQPLSVWRSYFGNWIDQPSKEAQMLASVMFDLRPIGGDTELFDGLHAETLQKASSNSFFTAHMASNALSHAPPLGLLRNLATISSGEHRKTIDMKHNGVVPVVDLGRMYALQGRITDVNTRARLCTAIEESAVSRKGGRNLLDAYDLVAQTRLEHQALQIKRGDTPDNYLSPETLSDFDRSHLRDAFVVIKTMQSALMQGRGVLA